MRMLRLAVIAATFAAAGSAQAFGIGARVGTTGVGADLAWNVAPMLDLRIGYSTLSWSRDVTTEGLRYDGRLRLGSVSGLIDFAPLGPFLRLTGGLTYNDNRYNVRATPPGGGAIQGRVEAGRDLAPYLGIGFGRVAGRGVNFYSDIGVVFQGSPRARLNADCTGVSPATCAQLQARAATDQGRLEDELRRFKHYPVLNIGLTIGF